MIRSGVKGRKIVNKKGRLKCQDTKSPVYIVIDSSLQTLMYAHFVQKETHMACGALSARALLKKVGRAAAAAAFG
jgi:hypothetical protein